MASTQRPQIHSWPRLPEWACQIRTDYYRVEWKGNRMQKEPASLCAVTYETAEGKGNELAWEKESAESEWDGRPRHWEARSIEGCGSLGISSSPGYSLLLTSPALMWAMCMLFGKWLLVWASHHNLAAPSRFSSTRCRIHLHPNTATRVFHHWLKLMPVSPSKPGFPRTATDLSGFSGESGLSPH